MEAVELLTRVGVSAWKVASGEVGTPQLLERMAETGLPVMLSTGMSPVSEIDAAVALIQRYNIPLAVMQCTSCYPCPPEKIGLNMIPFFRDRYNCSVGLSDHSATIFSGLAAVVLGADVLEVHVTLSREMFGPDISSSVTTSELRQLVEGARFIEKSLSNPVDKDLLAEEARPLRDVFTKSVVAGSDLPVGTVLQEQQLKLKKPGTGIPAYRIAQLIGARLVREVKADELIMERDLEGFQ
jgi:N-acetylneuraminate synthase